VAISQKAVIYRDPWFQRVQLRQNGEGEEGKKKGLGEGQKWKGGEENRDMEGKGGEMAPWLLWAGIDALDCVVLTTDTLTIIGIIFNGKS